MMARERASSSVGRARSVRLASNPGPVGLVLVFGEPAGDGLACDLAGPGQAGTVQGRGGGAPAAWLAAAGVAAGDGAGSTKPSAAIWAVRRAARRRAAAGAGMRGLCPCLACAANLGIGILQGMTLGAAPRRGGSLASTAAFCEGRIAPDSVYGLLHRECSALFPDEMFADLFAVTGRRPVPPVIVAVVMVLQHLEGCSDREAADRFAFDARWK